MINWYPGHMTKAMRMIEENLRLVDLIVYVLDARAPYSCLNPEFDRRIVAKPVLFALNKAELADRQESQRWVQYLSQGGRVAFTLTGTNAKSTAFIVSKAQALCREKLEKSRAKGIRAGIKLMVLGVPNTGKSTIINSLCGSAKTVTGNKAGVTRGKQWVRVGEYLDVLDTPGTLYPKLSNQTVAKRLAYLGSIKDEITDTPELAAALLAELMRLAPQNVQARYGLGEDSIPTLEGIAQKRGFMLRGGIADIDRTATAVVDDFRKGRFGAVTLDRVDELYEHETDI